MKKMKKVLSLILTVVMVLAMSATAFAQAGKTEYEKAGTITINDAESGQTYNAYQILYLESYHVDNSVTGEGKYAYKVTDTWANFFAEEDSSANPPTGGGPGLTYVDIDSQGYVTWKTDANVEAFAKAAQAWAKANNITATKTQTVTGVEEGQNPTKNNVVTFSQLDLGYYLVDTTLGTLCSLDTTNPSVNMTEKNESPTNEKNVKEDDMTSDEWESLNDASVGQTVEFKSTITAQKGAENYVFHDKMSDGLTFGSVTSITLNGNTVNNTNYEVKTENLENENACTFHVVFTDVFCNGLDNSDKIVIYYTATVNKDAVIAGIGNTNESKVEYGDEDDTTTTPPSTTTTYTWSFEIFKHAGEGEDVEALAGAEFALTPNQQYIEADKLKFHVTTDGDATTEGGIDIEDVYTLCADTSCTEQHVTTFTTNASGLIKLQGLDSGVYYLHEIAAPEGYNKLAAPVKVEIKKGTDGTSVTIHQNDGTDGVEKVDILNQTGALLPSTGGIGTTIFYLVGILVMAGAVFFVIRSRRNEN